MLLYGYIDFVLLFLKCLDNKKQESGSEKAEVGPRRFLGFLMTLERGKSE